MKDWEKQKIAKNMADRLRGDIVSFEYNGVKFTYSKTVVAAQEEFEAKRKQELYKETGNPVFLL